jgi:alginate O-acetyltransferase complex protein AlgI
MIFLPVSLLLFNSIERRWGHRAALVTLIAASLVFYASWNPSYLPILLLSLVSNFFAGYVIEQQIRSGVKLLVLITAISANLLILISFKYLLYFVYLANLNLGDRPLWFLTSHDLPLGISFWTFQQILFLFERYKKIQGRLSFLHYSCIVSFFPHLIAGPIVRIAELAPQVSAVGRRDRDSVKDAAVGSALFIVGLAKKSLIADSISAIPNSVFDERVGLSPWLCWLAAASYMLQLYFDFSGYCDMGTGLARMFGFIFPINFNSPLRARSFVEFWRAWHISLTRFFSETVYLPLALALSRRFVGRPSIWQSLITVCVPVFITFFLTGIWHGAGNQFVMFGILNGAFMAVGLLIAERARLLVPDLIATIFTFLLVSMVFVFFRAANLSAAAAFLEQMFAVTGGHGPEPGVWIERHFSAFLMLIPAFLIALWSPNLYEFAVDLHQPIGFKARNEVDPRFRIALNIWWGSALGLLLSACIISVIVGKVIPFIYFQF